MIIQTFSKKN